MGGHARPGRQVVIGARVEPAPPPVGGRRRARIHPRADDSRARAAYRSLTSMLSTASAGSVAAGSPREPTARDGAAGGGGVAAVRHGRTRRVRRDHVRDTPIPEAARSRRIGPRLVHRFRRLAIAAHPERTEMPARHRILALLGVIVAAGALGRFPTSRRMDPRPLLRGDRCRAQPQPPDGVAHLSRRNRPIRCRLSGQRPGRGRGHFHLRDPPVVLRNAAAPLPRRSARRAAGLPASRRRARRRWPSAAG